MPGVSRKTICDSGVVTTPWMEVRVVCGLSATIATFWPTRALSSVDFPAFGPPMRETKPDLNFLFMRDCLGLAETDLFDAEIVAGENFDAGAVAIHRLALLGHPAQPFAEQPSDRGGFEIFFGVERIQQAGDPAQVEVTRDDIA